MRRLPLLLPLLLPLFLLGLVLGGCRSSATLATGDAGSGVRDPLPPRRVEPLPDAWDTCSPYGFEQLVQALSTRAPFVYSAADNERLARALATSGQVAVRAAVLLGHGLGPQAEELLIARLEGRHDAPSRELDAGDLVAAAALTGRGAAIVERLVELVVGARPHPDLEVRVEIARSALFARADGVIPFLLQVMRAGTPAEALAPPDWARTTTYAWAKSRAAEALSARARHAIDGYSPDSSWQDQNDVADALETALRANGALSR